MLITWFALLSFQSRMIVLQDAPKKLVYTKVADEGIFGVQSRNLYRWDFNGHLIEELTLGEPVLRIRAFQYHDDGYWISYLTKDEAYSQFFSRQGKPLTEPLAYIDFYRKVDGKIFGPYTMSRERFFLENNYPFLAMELKLEQQGPQYGIADSDLIFAKVNDRMLSMEMAYKPIWIVADGDRYLVMNQLEPHVYFFDQVAMRQEWIDGQQKPTLVNHTELDLGFYEEPPERIFRLERTVLEAEGRRLMRNWFTCMGLITYFGRLDDGFVVSYRIPHRVGDTCEGTGLGLQKVNDQFQSVGTALAIDGKMMGAYQGEVYVFENNRVKVYQLKD